MAKLASRRRLGLGFILSWTVATELALVSACDVHETPDYQGEPLATLQVTLVGSSKDPVEDAELVTVWLGLKVDDEGVPVEPRFYAQAMSSKADATGRVTMIFYERPPEEVRDGWFASPILDYMLAEALISDFESVPRAFTDDVIEAIRDDIGAASVGEILGVSTPSDELPKLWTERPDESEIAKSFFGCVEAFVLHLPDPIEADSLAGRLLGGSLEAGFHFFRWEVPSEEADNELQSCLAQSATGDEAFDCWAVHFAQTFPLLQSGDTVPLVHVGSEGCSP